ncbi:MAG: NADH:flavin oxidoreductase/NADH oxidase [Proteobacteria bacterium]|nr:NADH:flavin oxidoreductase/NADH oxidase [Pseudomonadota bacterium]
MTSKLLSPFKLREVELPNRIVVSPMQMYMAKENGECTDWHLVHLGKFAVGNFGTVFTEVLCVEARGRSTYSDAGIWSDEHIPMLKKIANFIRSNGSVPAVQIGHCGPKSSRQRPYDGLQPLSSKDANKGEPPWEIVSCSAEPAAPGYAAPHALTESEVGEVVLAFGQAARRCNLAGFEVLDVHAAHGYLIHSFLSPISNNRHDLYGGNKTNRMRFALEIAEALRRNWPDEKPILFRLSCIDRFEGGLEIGDTIELSRELKKRGVDAIDCSSGGIKGPNSLFSLAEPPTPGYQVPLAAAIRDGAEMPTMAVGMIMTPAHAEEIISDGSADLIALGREALFNPHWGLHAAKLLNEGQTFDDWPPNMGWWLEVRQRMLSSTDPKDWRIGPAAANAPKKAQP